MGNMGGPPMMANQNLQGMQQRMQMNQQRMMRPVQGVQGGGGLRQVRVCRPSFFLLNNTVLYSATTQ